MKTFQKLAWGAAQCRREVEELQALLASSPALKERDTLLPFFQVRRHLSAFFGVFHTGILRYDLVAHEYDLFGDFTCDLAVGDSQRKTYGFIELEDAAPGSLFVQKRGKSSPEWAPRFEHGFSQVLDWFCKLDDMEKTDEFENRFGQRSISYFGLLIIGRSEGLGVREARRLHWRKEKVLVNSNHVYCLTYDQLCQDLSAQLERLRLRTTR